jgi:hypothetical protein
MMLSEWNQQCKASSSEEMPMRYVANNWQKMVVVTSVVTCIALFAQYAAGSECENNAQGAVGLEVTVADAGCCDCADTITVTIADAAFPFWNGAHEIPRVSAGMWYAIVKPLEEEPDAGIMVYAISYDCGSGQVALMASCPHCHTGCSWWELWQVNIGCPDGGAEWVSKHKSNDATCGGDYNVGPNGTLTVSQSEPE